MQATTLLIARHGNNFEPGETILRLGAKSDMPLSQSGMAQGLALGEYLKQNRLIPQKIFTSKLQRTIQMAQQIEKAIGEKIPMEYLEVFNEIDYGPDEGKTEDEILHRLGEDALRNWDENGLAPNGWQVDATGLRAAWYDLGERIASEYAGQTVLIITHNGVARFASILTGDAGGLHASDGARLSTGAFGHLVHTDPFWECIEWNVKP
jgi:2,3-bisphosphoglycerate-dependent phosphoglycerate mutase